MSTDKIRSGLTRREMLKGAVAGGAAATVLPLLPGCPILLPVNGEQGPRERRTLHFDFSHLGEQQRSEQLVLHVFGSSSHLSILTAHDAASRERFHQLNPALSGVADEAMTHYAEDISFPADALQLYWVTLGERRTGNPRLAAAFLHLPTKTREVIGRRARRRRTEGRTSRRAQSRKLFKYLGRGQSTGSGAASSMDLADFQTPHDAARAFVFQHPEIRNLDPALAGVVQDIIDTTPELDDLATAIAAQGPAGTDSGWVRLVSLTNDDGTAAVDSDGNPVIQQDPSQQTLDAAQRVIASVLRQVFNEPDLEGSNWHGNLGTAFVDQSAFNSSGAMTAARLAQSTGFRAALAFPADTAVPNNLYGLLFRNFTVDASRTFYVVVENVFIRALDAWAEYHDADGVVLDLQNPAANDLPGQRLQYLGRLPSNSTILGIPLLDDNTLRRVTLSASIPADATSARLVFGTLGIGGPQFAQPAQNAATYTLVVNIAIPTFLLAVGVGVQASGLLEPILSDPEFLAALAAAAAFLDAGGSFAYAASTGDWQTVVTSNASLILSLLLKQSPKFAARLLGFATAEELQQSVPFVGWALKGFALAASIATLAETLGEVLATPQVFDNTITLTQDTTVAVGRDPRNFQFPAGATRLQVFATYAAGNVYRTEMAFETPRSDPLSVTFANVPSGGNVEIRALLLSNSGCVLGHGIYNGPNSPAATGTVTIDIEEVLVPLVAATRYQHQQLLQYDPLQRQYEWNQTTAPTATRASLNCSGVLALCELGGITVNQATGMAGYSWRATGFQLPICGGGTASTAYRFRNIFLGQNPQSGLKLPACNYAERTAIGYDRGGPPDGSGQNYYVDSILAANGQYHLRRITLDTATPINTGQTMSYGAFHLPVDAMAVHGSGFAVGINRQMHKLEVLQILAAPLPDNDADSASLRSGLGDREGLLNDPVAVTITVEGVVLVLEAGNQRVQAFDRFGNPVNHFGTNRDSPFAALQTESGVTYLDLGVDGAGYVFVLSYTGTGSAVGNYRLDVYSPTGDFVTRTTGLAAGRMAVDLFRNVYALNYQSSIGPDAAIEPTLSEWIPTTPGGCP